MKPFITILTVSYNTDLHMVRQCLVNLSQQDYPKNRICHIVMDGGSSNGSVELAKSFGCEVFIEKQYKNLALMRAANGIKRAKGDILLILEFDNFVTSKTWLSQMIQPFIDNPNIVGTFSKYNYVDRRMPLLTRYCGLFGINDPLVLFLGKSEKLTHYETVYKKGHIVSSNNKYESVIFNSHNLPTLGDNGHMVRLKYIKSVLKDNEQFLHTDMFMRLVMKKYNLFGVVNNSVVHFTGKSLQRFIKRRVIYRNQYSDSSFSKRDYLVFDSNNSRDLFSLIIFCFCTITIVPNILMSLRGFISKPDIAWFMHPIVCWLTLIGYAKLELSKYFNLGIKTDNH